MSNWIKISGGWIIRWECHCSRIHGEWKVSGRCSSIFIERSNKPSYTVCPKCGCEDSYFYTKGRYEWEEKAGLFSIKTRNKVWVKWTQCSEKYS